MPIQTTFSGYAFVELMGHSAIAGYVSECSVGGVTMLRVDVPEIKQIPAFTRFYSPAAVYAISPCDEAFALSKAQNLWVRPIQAYEIGEVIAKMAQNNPETLFAALRKADMLPPLPEVEAPKEEEDDFFRTF